jgi:alkanesulfonate monooxygenase SsuD/methylene tetrahydromethanopterin reductase-like flavin-dependent oxidoreductase (luciferase family)
MTARPFRFGVSMTATETRSAWQAKARQAEGLGYDVLQVPDRLGMPAPFPALVSAGEVTSLRLGTFVLNTGFYRPAVLARDVAATDQLTDGRLEFGLGTGGGRVRGGGAAVSQSGQANRPSGAYRRRAATCWPATVTACSGWRLICARCTRGCVP